MNHKKEAQDQRQKIDKEVLGLASKLGNSIGFFRYYWQILPKCKTQKAAYLITNLMYLKIFGEEKYSSYDSFKNQFNKKINKL